MRSAGVGALEREFQSQGYVAIPAPLLSSAQSSAFARSVRMMYPAVRRRLFNSAIEDGRRTQASWQASKETMKGRLETSDRMRALATALRLERAMTLRLRAALEPTPAPACAPASAPASAPATAPASAPAQARGAEKGASPRSAPANFDVSWQGLVSQPRCKEQQPHVDVIARIKRRGEALPSGRIVHRPFVLVAVEEGTRLVVWPRSHAHLRAFKGSRALMPSVVRVSAADRLVIAIPTGHGLLVHGDLVHAGAAYKTHNVRLLTTLYARGSAEAERSYAGAERNTAHVRAEVVGAEPAAPSGAKRRRESKGCEGCEGANARGPPSAGTRTRSQTQRER